MATRYTLLSSVYGPMMDKSKDGPYVKFDDYERLRQDYLDLKEDWKELGKYLAFRTVSDHIKSQKKITWDDVDNRFG